MKRKAIAFGFALALLAPSMLSAQQPARPERANQGGEVRGTERADQVRGANAEKRDAKAPRKDEHKPEKERGAKKP